jgi:putative Holliday junction resolvase
LNNVNPSDHESMFIPPQGRLIGVDFGTVRIGIAICDPGQSIASPLEIYQRRNTKLDADYFVKLAKQEQAVGLIVGLPVHMSGEASQKSKEAKTFGLWLHEITDVPVAWVDERYSTALAREVLNQESLSPKKKKAKLDKIAAQIILRTYLERNKDSDDQTINSLS